MAVGVEYCEGEDKVRAGRANYCAVTLFPTITPCRCSVCEGRYA